MPSIVLFLDWLGFWLFFWFNLLFLFLFWLAFSSRSFNLLLWLLSGLCLSLLGFGLLDSLNRLDSFNFDWLFLRRFLLWRFSGNLSDLSLRVSGKTHWLIICVLFNLHNWLWFLRRPWRIFSFPRWLCPKFSLGSFNNPLSFVRFLLHFFHNRGC